MVLNIPRLSDRFAVQLLGSRLNNTKLEDSIESELNSSDEDHRSPPSAEEINTVIK